LSEWSKLRSDQHNNKAPDESGAVVLGPDRGDGGSGQAVSVEKRCFSTSLII
jgi:hypothetical protein